MPFSEGGQVYTLVIIKKTEWGTLQVMVSYLV